MRPPPGTKNTIVLTKEDFAMFAKMKTGTKVLAGFGIAMVVAVVVGLVGYVGIKKLSAHVEEIGLVRLPSVQELLKIQVGSEQIKNAERTLLNVGLDLDTRHRQTNNVAKAREQYEAAWKTYEALPQTPEEAELWKQFVPAWQEWRNDNNEFFTISRQVNELMEKCPGAASSSFSLPEALQRAENECHAVAESFVGQVQEWKDILLRGNDPADYDKYVAAFEKRASDVRAGLTQLQTTITEIGIDSQKAADITKAHADLCAKYRDALKGFDKSKPDAGKAADKLVRGLDRPVTAALNDFALAINEKATKLRELEAKMIAKSTGACRAAMAKANDLLDQVVKLNMNVGEESLKQAQADSAFAVWAMMTAMSIGAVVLLALGVFMAVNISKMLKRLIGETVRLSDDAVAGKLQSRGNLDLVGSEFRPIVEGVNATLDALVGPINVTAEYVDRISKGDIPPKITDAYNGDFNEIKVNLNQCIDAVNALVADAIMLAKAGVEGKLGTRADATKHQGEYRKIVQGVNDTLDSVMGPLNDAARCLKALAAKDFSKTIEGNYVGDFKELKNNINAVVENVSMAITQINESANQFTEGSRTIAESAQTLAQGRRRKARAYRKCRLRPKSLPDRSAPSRRAPMYRPRWPNKPASWPKKAARPFSSRSRRWSRFAPVRSKSARSSR